MRGKRDPHRKLTRYREADRKVFANVRLNLGLWERAAEGGFAVVRPLVPEEDVIEQWGLLQVGASVDNYKFLEDLCEHLEERGRLAHYLGDRHGDGRRDHFFAAEDVSALHAVAVVVGAGRPFRVEVEKRRLADEAPDLLPLELQHRLGFTPQASDPPRRVQFGFTGPRESLAGLRGGLEPLGFVFVGLEPAALAPGVWTLRTYREMHADEATFLAVMRQIVPLSRKLACSYDGAETVDGPEQFLPTSPLPPRFGG